MRPVDVNEKTVDIAFSNLYRYINGYISKKFKNGDYVRIAKRKSAFEKGATSNYTSGIFQIDEVLNKENFAVYKLRSPKYRNYFNFLPIFYSAMSI